MRFPSSIMTYLTSVLTGEITDLTNKNSKEISHDHGYDLQNSL